jgi:hypothetical protein
MQPPRRSALILRGKCWCSRSRTRMRLHGTAVTDGPEIDACRDAARVRDRRGPRSARRRLECAVGRSEESGVLSGRQHWSARACSPARASRCPIYSWSAWCHGNGVSDEVPDASARFVGDSVDGAVVPAPHRRWRWRCRAASMHAMQCEAEASETVGSAQYMMRTAIAGTSTSANRPLRIAQGSALLQTRAVPTCVWACS